MNLAEHAPLWLAVMVLIAFLAAAVEDIVRLRISNFTSVAVMVGALVAMALQGFQFSLWENAAVFVAILVLGTFAFSNDLLGGGDVKLFAATGLWMNLNGAIWLIAGVFLAGGVVALAFILVRLARGSRPKRKGGNRIPYGVAIATGALYVLGVQYADGHAKRGYTPLPPVRGLAVNR
jgi:prepilin peptidase CpaA